MAVLTPHGADAAEYTLRELERHGHIQVEDAAVVSWEPDAKKPHTRRLGSTGKHNTLKGSFWGLVLGLIFFVPILGVAVGATVGKLALGCDDAGIDDDFVETVRREVVPGTSAIFLKIERRRHPRGRPGLQGPRARPDQYQPLEGAEQRLRRLLDDADEARQDAAGS